MAHERSRRGCGYWLLGCGGVTLLIVVLLCAGGGYAYRLWHRLPDQWLVVQEQLDRTPPADRQRTAIALENRVASALSFAEEQTRAMQTGQPPGVVTRTIRLTPDEVNAWLAERLDAWASNQRVGLPDEVTQYRFWIDAGQPVLAAHVQAGDVGQVVSVRFRPQVLPDGRMTIPIEEVRAGQLAIPLSQALSQAGEYVNTVERQAQFQQAASIFEGQPFDPVVPEVEGYRLRVTGLEVAADEVVLTVRAEPVSR